MRDVAIRVENLSKKYKIGANQARYQTIRESVVNGFLNSLNQLRGEKTARDNSIWALKDVDFEVKHGEVLGIIGKNGAGKSTLLKILARITKPTTGRIELNGRVGSLLEVGTGFHPELSGRENIFLSGAILGMHRHEIKLKFDEIVDFAEIEKFLDTPVKHFSSGMYMRLAFAVAAHLEPEILLVDEVLAVGDAEFQMKCLGKMGRVAKEGRTVLFVSHNMGAIETLCEKCLLLYDGKKFQISQHVHDVVGHYIRSGLINNKVEFDLKRIRNEYFQLLNFKILRKTDNQETTLFAKSDDIEINIVLDVLEKNPSLSIGYAFYDSSKNIPLWWSFDVDFEPIVLDKGMNTLRTTIPKGILNDGDYRVELIAGIHNQKWLLTPGQTDVSIEFIVKGGSLGSAGFSSTRRPTSLMPLLGWSNEPKG